MYLCRRIFYLAIFFVHCSFIACSDPAGTPDENSEGTGGKLDGFAIVAATQDTLYVDENAWIDAREIDSDPATLKLFIHTVPCAIDSVVGERIHFRIPDNASAGRARLYKHDTVEAQGNFIIHAIPRRISSFVSQPDSIRPLHGFVGDLRTIRCIDPPLRKKDIKVTVGGVEFDIVDLSEDQFVVRVPEDARSGNVLIKIFDKIWERGEFVLHTGGEKFLKEGTMSTLLLSAFRININWDMASIKGDDTTHRFEPGEYSSYIESRNWNADVKRIGDSIFILEAREYQGFYQTLDIRLKVEESTNRIWGTIHTTRSSLTEFTKYTESFTLDGFRYYDNNGKYEFYASSEDVLKRLKDLEYIYETTEGYADLTEIVGVNEGAFLQLVLTK